MVGFYMNGKGIKDVHRNTHVLKRKSPLRLIMAISRILHIKKEDQKSL